MEQLPYNVRLILFIISVITTPFALFAIIEFIFGIDILEYLRIYRAKKEHCCWIVRSRPFYSPHWTTHGTGTIMGDFFNRTTYHTKEDAEAAIPEHKKDL